MATSALADYFGATLAGGIVSNAQAVGNDLGISAADCQNADRVIAAIFKQVHAWLTADGTKQNFTEIIGYGPGGLPTIEFGAGGRFGQRGWRLWLILWENAVDPALIVPYTRYSWGLINGVWEYQGKTFASIEDGNPSDFLLLSSTFNPSNPVILFEAYYSNPPSAEVSPQGLPISPTTILFESYYSAAPVVEVI